RLFDEPFFYDNPMPVFAAHQRRINTAATAITNTTPNTIRAIQGAVSQTPVTPAIWPTFFSVRRKLGSRKGLPH
ncbi:hypothetical protein, partial [Pseudomonas tehranensis]|uniref:hypothetical protein n=1 Tax=Pseudomonas tehranensis TaxID=2745502 RepID=UPI001CD889A9